MKKPVIAVDIDDVLSDSARGLIDFSNRQFGSNLDIDDYDEHLMEMWKVDFQESERRLGMFFEMNSFLAYGHNPGALPVLNKLKEKYNLIIVTSRRIRAKTDTLAWLNEKYPGIFQENNIHFTGFHDDVAEHTAKLTKGDQLKTLGADYLIDDQLKHCAAAAAQGIKTLLFGNYKWNQTDELPDRVVRVTDWVAVEEYFNERD